MPVVDDASTLLLTVVVSVAGVDDVQHAVVALAKTAARLMRPITRDFAGAVRTTAPQNGQALAPARI